MKSKVKIIFLKVHFILHILVAHEKHLKAKEKRYNLLFLKIPLSENKRKVSQKRKIHFFSRYVGNMYYFENNTLLKRHYHTSL